MNGTGSFGQNSSIINITLKLIGIVESELKKAGKITIINCSYLNSLQKHLL